MDVLGITIIFIAVSTVITAILKAIHKDACLKDFNKFNITIIETNGEKYYGKLRLEPSGLELIYKKPFKKEDGKKESSYIFYANEYENIKILVRLHKNLTKENKIKRKKEIQKSYHPKFFRKFTRKFINFCKTIKDAIAEVVGLLMSQARKSHKGIQSQDRQINKIKDNIFGSIENTSFDPLLENHIGNIVILEFEEEKEKIINYYGVLKEYTSEFIEIMDVSFEIKGKKYKSDLIVPRRTSIVRHLGE